MTEEDAKTKECRAPGVALSDTRGGWQLPMCSASDCMMWEPYEYYIDGKGEAWSQQNHDETLVLVTGGDCGIKSKEIECRGF